MLSFRRFGPVLAVSLAFLIPPGLATADAGQNAGASAATAGSANGAVHSQRVCATVPAGYAACHARVVTDGNRTPLSTKTWGGHGYSPTQLRTAYGLTGMGSTTTVAIVDAYANPNAAADLAAYRKAFTIVGSGTLTQVNQTGGPITTVRGNVGWGQEEMLDLEMISAICPDCKIIYVGANSASFDDLGAAVDTAASLASVVSNSYGAPEFSGETAYAIHYNHPGVAITVSSGDAGYGVEAPAAFNTVTAVGGTTLKLKTDNTRLSETVWSGAGSGCSAYIEKPSWQGDATTCSNRTVADVAAVADPATGVAVYDSYGSHRGNWYVFGGTSVAAPIIGAVYALSGNTAGVPASVAYAAPSGSLFDVNSGSNGSCTVAYLCTGVSGYDGPTGNGTPNGAGAF